MTHREATERFCAEMRARGVHPLTAAPPFFQLLWKWGVEVRPPLCLPPLRFGLLTGSTIAIPFAAVCALLPGELVPLWAKVAVPLLIGLTFGVAMALCFRRLAASLGNPSWESFQRA